MIRRLWTLPLLLFSLCAATLHAQARLAIYGTVGGEKSGLRNEGWTTAGTLGLYVGVANLGPLALSVDGRADLSTNINSFIVGPRLALHFPVFPLKPYVEFLLGESAYTTQNNGPKNTDSFTYRYVGGVDTAILPHLDWRVLDFSYSGGISQFNTSVNPKTLSTGLVVRF
jgi:hypothetical protein